MRYLQFTKYFTAILFVLAVCGSCDKVEKFEPLNDTGQHIISFTRYGASSGLGFAASNLAFDPTSTDETLDLQLEYSTDKVSDKDISVTVAIDAASLAAFNAIPDNPQYELLPDSTFSFVTTTVLIKAGNVYSEPFAVIFHPDKIDGTINYMLPLKITNISGAPADVQAGPGTGTAYFHFIGNPLAGFYDVVGTRYNYVGAVTWAGPPNPLPAGGTPSAIPTVKFASAIDASTVQIDFAALGAGVLNYFYLVSASGPGPAVPDYSAISVTYSSALLGASSSREQFITDYIPPSPGVKPEFHIITHYNNNIGGAGAGGNDRIVDEYFKHQ